MSDHTLPREWVDRINIDVDGNTLPINVFDRLMEVMVDTTLHLPAMFQIRFNDEDMSLMSDGPFELGALVRIMMATGDNDLEHLMTGEITTIEPEFTEDLTVILTITGYDLGHRLNRGTKSRVFVQMSDSDIIQQIAQEASLQVDAESTAQIHEHVFQDAQTDLEFVQERARRNGYEVFVDDTRLIFRSAETQRENVALSWGRNLQRFMPRLSLVGQVDEVIVKGWNPVEKAGIVGQAARSSSAPQINYGSNGGQMANEAFSSAQQIVVRRPVATQPEADALAQALLDEINAGFVEAEGRAVGNPKIVAGVKVTVDHIGRRFQGEYVVTAAAHVYSQGGYEVHFRVEGACARLMSDLLEEAKTHDAGGKRWNGVVPAQVTNNEDPENMGRVKVKFPWLDNDLESHWARVIGIGAGHERGIYFLPEINDEVMVVFEQGDFNHPYVIGGVWNGQDAPPEPLSETAKNGNIERRTIKTREGHTIRLIDDSGGPKIEIIDSDECNQIILDVKAQVLTLKTKGKLQLQSEGETQIEAKGNLTIKGSANINVEATGNLTLKGQLVNIN